MNGPRLLTAIICLSLAFGAFAAPVLFPQPLHLTRVVDNPLSSSGSSVIEEFYIANRVISVAGDRTVIADYDRGEVTEIDRAEGTYSVTPFAALAEAAPKTRQRIATDESEEDWAIRETARPERPNAEFFDATPKTRGDIRRLEVGVDRSVRLTRDALDVIVGAAYPNERAAEADVYVRAAGPSRDAHRAQSNSTASASNAAAPADVYGLPVEQTVTYDAGGTEVVVRNRVTRVGKELPPPALLAIPPGATRVESQRVQTRRKLDELDSIPTTDQKP